MTPPGLIDKLIHLITNSGPLGFSLFFAGTVIFALRYFKPEAVAFIDPNALSYILYVALIGAGLVFLKAWNWLNRRQGQFSKYLKERNRHVTAVDRIDDLLPDELRALCWMLVNDGLKIHGRLIDAPFDGLLRKGFLITTDGRQIHQIFRVHPYVKSKSEQILSFLTEADRKEIEGIAPPWNPRYWR